MHHKHQWNTTMHGNACQYYNWKKCNYNIEVSTLVGEKVKISLISGVEGNGYKIPSVLIFKAKKEGRIEKTLDKLELIKQKKIYIYCWEYTCSY